MISLKGWSEETLTGATALLRKAASLDPDFALARAQLALFLSLGARQGLMADAAAAVTEARAEAERAVTIDPDASEVLGYAGCALAELGDVQRGAEILERAIENDPSNAQAWVALGTAQFFLEKMGDVGLEKLRQGMRLSPRDHRLGFWGTFYALALATHRRLEEAYGEARTACRRDPQFYVARIVLALTAAGLDRKDDAIAALREAKRLRPRLSIEQFSSWWGVARTCSLRSGTKSRNHRTDHGRAASGRRLARPSSTRRFLWPSCYRARSSRRPMSETRKLAAILAADVVGYSRLMGEDEAGTARAVREHARRRGPS